MSVICPAITDLQIHTGFQNIEKWKIRAENEKKMREKEDRLNEKLEAFRLDELKSELKMNNK